VDIYGKFWVDSMVWTYSDGSTKTFGVTSPPATLRSILLVPAGDYINKVMVRADATYTVGVTLVTANQVTAGYDSAFAVYGTWTTYWAPFNTMVTGPIEAGGANGPVITGIQTDSIALNLAGAAAPGMPMQNQIDICPTLSTSLFATTLVEVITRGPYMDNEACSLNLDTQAGQTIRIRFTNFSTEAAHDFLNIYDGANATAPLLLSASGTVLPAMVISSGSSLFMQWTSDAQITAEGWTFTYTMNVPVGSSSFAINDYTAGPHDLGTVSDNGNVALYGLFALLPATALAAFVAYRRSVVHRDDMLEIDEVQANTAGPMPAISATPEVVSSGIVVDMAGKRSALDA